MSTPSANDALRTFTKSFPEAMDKITNFFRGSIVTSQASTTQSSTAATPRSSDYCSANDTRRREPSLSWAMQSCRSLDRDLRDYCLLPGGVERPTGRLTSADPRFPTTCHLDKMWSFNDESTIPSQQFFDRSAFQRTDERSDDKAGDDYDPIPPPAIARPTTTYEPDPSDLLDQHVASCLRHSRTTNTVIRLSAGTYEVNKRQVTLRWKEGGGKHRGHLEVTDGPLTQPFLDYLQGKEESAVYNFEDHGAIGAIPKSERLSFGDEQYQSYTRLEAMRVAKEQAKLRESSAMEAQKNSSSTYRNHEEHMERYREWHVAQLRVDAPMYQGDDEDDLDVVRKLSQQSPSRRHERQLLAPQQRPQEAVQQVTDQHGYASARESGNSQECVFNMQAMPSLHGQSGFLPQPAGLMYAQPPEFHQHAPMMEAPPSYVQYPMAHAPNIQNGHYSIRA